MNLASQIQLNLQITTPDIWFCILLKAWDSFLQAWIHTHIHSTYIHTEYMIFYYLNRRFSQQYKHIIKIQWDTSKWKIKQSGRREKHRIPRRTWKMDNPFRVRAHKNTSHCHFQPLPVACGRNESTWPTMWAQIQWD